MSLIQASCDLVSLQDRAATLTPRFLNSPCSLATEPSSVVHTGVKSEGWLKSTAQAPSMYSCHRSGPSVESALKSGTVVPKRIFHAFVHGEPTVRPLPRPKPIATSPRLKKKGAFLSKSSAFQARGACLCGAEEGAEGEGGRRASALPSFMAFVRGAVGAFVGQAFAGSRSLQALTLGITFGIYLDQNYTLPNVKEETKR